MVKHEINDSFTLFAIRNKIQQMIHSKNILRSFFLSSIITFFGLWFWYGEFFMHSGNLIQNDGDGKKNYYTVEYHVLHDSDAWHFNGMNYPFGEHVLFTDDQPIYANLLQFIHHHIIDLTGRVVSIINYSMIASILICSWILCLIFLEFEVNGWYAAIAATGISFLSPQLSRFGGHYALAYSFYIPLVWLLFLKYFKRRQWKNTFYIAIVIILFSLIHLYYLPIGVSLGICLWFFYAIKKKPKWRKASINFSIQIALPYLIVLGFLLITDTVSDRPDNPYGFFKFKATWESVFIPVKMPIGSFIHTHIVKIRDLDFESISYLGLASTFLFLILLFNLFRYSLAGKIKKINPAPGDYLMNISFWSACIILLFSLGLPFILKLEWLLDYTGPLRQFRSIGRFAWTFYYIMNVYTFTIVYKYWQKRKKGALQIGLMILALSLLTYDNLQTKRYTPSATKSDESPFDKSVLDPNQYQAILSVPYFHDGSENLEYESRCNNMSLSMDLSLKTGLPLLAIQLDRTSNAQTLKSIPLMFEEYRPLKIINEFKNHKPLLIITPSKCTLSKSEQHWLDMGDEKWENSDFKLYSLSYDSLKAYGGKMMQKKKLFLDSCSNQIANDGAFYYKSFDNSISFKTYSGGAKSSEPGKDLLLYDSSLTFIKGNEALISFWVYVGRYPHALMRINEKEFRSDVQDKIIANHNSQIKNAIQVIDGDWALVEYKFECKNVKNKFRITIDKYGTRKNIIIADELLIRAPGSHICNKSKPGFKVFNNRFYPESN